MSKNLKESCPSDSVSQSSVNLDCSEIDSPDEVIRVGQRFGFFADTRNCLGYKYFLVPGQKLYKVETCAK